MCALQLNANPDCDLLADRLRAVEVGGLVTYQTLSATIERRVDGPARYLLDAARKRLEREGIVFGAVTRVGLRRLADEDKASLANATSKKILRTAKRGVKRCAVDDITKLPPKARERHVLEISRLALLASVASEQSAKKLAPICAQSTPPSAAMFEALRK